MEEPPHSDKNEASEEERGREHVRQELIKTGKVTKFIPPLPEHLPDDMGQREGNLFEAIDIYLGLPIVHYAPRAFANIYARKDWKTKTLTGEQRDVVNGDAMRVNSLNSVFGQIDLALSAKMHKDEGAYNIYSEFQEIKKEREKLWASTSETFLSEEETKKKTVFVNETLKPFLLRARSFFIALEEEGKTS